MKTHIARLYFKPLHHHLKTGLRLGLLMATGFALPSCYQQHVAKDVPSPTGVYTLASVDTRPVPAEITHDSHILQIKSGTFTIASNGTCTSKIVFVPPMGKETVREVTATFTRRGSKLTMQWRGAGQTIGIVEGDSFTMTNEGTAFCYRK